jgi:hypothetical protein
MHTCYKALVTQNYQPKKERKYTSESKRRSQNFDKFDGHKKSLKRLGRNQLS